MPRIKTYFQVFWQFRKLYLMRMMEYRQDFFFWSFVSLMWTAFNFFFFTIIVRLSGNIGGWNEGEMYLLMSTFTILDAFTWSFFYHTMMSYTNAVYSGSFDIFLVRPINTQFLIAVHSNSYNNIFRLLVGAGALIWSLKLLHLTPSFWQILAYLLLLATALFFIYNIWFIIATLAFWIEKLNNINDIIPALRRTFQVPRSVYTGVASLIFTVFLPFGLISSLPSEVLLGKASLSWILYFAFATLISFVISRLFFKFSVKKYSGVGS